MSDTVRLAKRKIGKALRWTDADLEVMSEITPEIIEDAKIVLRRDTGRSPAAAYADAVPTDEGR